VTALLQAGDKPLSLGSACGGARQRTGATGRDPGATASTPAAVGGVTAAGVRGAGAYWAGPLARISDADWLWPNWPVQVRVTRFPGW
jgi:hypothetical protein